MRIAFFGDSLTEGIHGISFLSRLEAQLPQHVYLNSGKGGETVRSLLRRVRRSGFPEGPDMSFIWVGVNDVLARTSLSHALLKLARRQPWTARPESFERIYTRLLNEVRRFSRRVFTVPPLLLGEDPRGRWNLELAHLAEVIERVAAKTPETEFIDIRAAFLNRLPPGTGEPFHPGSFRDWLRSGKEIPPRRDYSFTIDGIHLNRRGAGLAAAVLAEAIRRASGPEEHSGPS